MCKIVILFLSTSKKCKIGLQAAGYKITSPVLCDIVFGHSLFHVAQGYVRIHFKWQSIQHEC